MPRRKKHLTKQDLRDLGATPGRLTTRYGPDGRATIRQVVGAGSSSFSHNTKHLYSVRRGGQQSN